MPWLKHDPNPLPMDSVYALVSCIIFYIDYIRELITRAVFFNPLPQKCLLLIAVHPLTFWGRQYVKMLKPLNLILGFSAYIDQRLL